MKKPHPSRGAARRQSPEPKATVPKEPKVTVPGAKCDFLATIPGSQRRPSRGAKGDIPGAEGDIPGRRRRPTF